jgi:hypothetical protein
MWPITAERPGAVPAHGGNTILTSTKTLVRGASLGKPSVLTAIGGLRHLRYLCGHKRNTQY